MTSASTEETPTDPVAHGEAAGREPWWKRLPLVWHLRRSVGLQRGMLVAGLVLSAMFVLMALLAPLHRSLQLQPALRPGRVLPRQAPPSAEFWWGPPWAATMCSPG